MMFDHGREGGDEIGHFGGFMVQIEFHGPFWRKFTLGKFPGRPLDIPLFLAQ